MSAAFEVYEHPNGGLRAGRCGFAWGGLIGAGLWTLRHGLWIRSLILLTAEAGLILFCVRIFGTLPPAIGIALALIHLSCGFAGHRWRTEAWQRAGHLFLGYVQARREADAVRNVRASRAALLPHSPVRRPSLLDRLPPAWRPTGNIAGLTLKAAVRQRLVPFLFATVLMIIVGMPMLLKHDDTADGFMQVVVTYTLGSVMAVLVLSTVWLAIGNLAREVEDGQIQLLVSKPVAAWRILLGKWLGIMVLNLGLLVFVGVGIQFFIEWRARQLPEVQQEALRDNLLVARAAIREALPDFDAIVDERYAQFRADQPNLEHDRALVRDELRKQLVAEFESVAPRHVRQWVFPVGSAAEALARGEAGLRVKFQAGYNRRPRAMFTAWDVGPAEGPRQRLTTTLTTDTVHHLPLENPQLDADGNLVVRFHNQSASSFVFTTGEGVQLLYREAGFTSNLVRAFAVLWCWLGLAAAVGITAATKLNFNVAAFFALGLIGCGMFTGTIESVVEQGGVWSYYEGELNLLQQAAGYVMYALIRALHLLMGTVRDYAPIASLGTGRSIAWTSLAAVFAHCWLLFGLVLAAIGIRSFQRRELADPFNN